MKNDSLYDTGKNLLLLNIEKSWELSQGVGVKIAGIEIGINLNFIITSIASGSRYVALAPERNANGSFTQIHVIDQIHNAVDKGFHIFCCPLAYPQLEYEKEWEEAIAKAVNNNMIIIAPTGNDNRRHICYPAMLEGVISVGASDDLGQRWINNRANGSNYGDKIDCIAPAYSGIRGFWDRFRYFDGGALAVAHIAGVVALLKSVNKSLSYQDVQDLIRKYSSHSVIGFSQELGFGLIDTFRALSSLKPLDVNTEQLIKNLRNIRLQIDSILADLGGEI